MILDDIHIRLNYTHKNVTKANLLMHSEVSTFIAISSMAMSPDPSPTVPINVN